MIKRMSANQGIQYHPKFVDPVMMNWAGRVIITLNDDASSLRIIPILDESIKDKISILKFSDAPREFPSAAELDEIIKRELPYFLRWLLDWTPPAEVMGDHRYGVKSFIHEGLREQSLYSGELGDILDVVRTWIKCCNPRERHGNTWRGTASDFKAELSNEDSIRPLIANYSTKSLGRKFMDAVGLNGSHIVLATATKQKGRGNVYEIDLEALTGIPG